MTKVVEPTLPMHTFPAHGHQNGVQTLWLESGV